MNTPFALLALGTLQSESLLLVGGTLVDILGGRAFDPAELLDEARCWSAEGRPR